MLKKMIEKVIENYVGNFVLTYIWFGEMIRMIKKVTLAVWS